MPFPFIPAGLLLAIAVLGIALVVFGLALKALDWSIDAARRTALPGIVTGLRHWQNQPGAPAAPSPPAAAAPSPPEVHEAVAALEGLEAVAPEGTHRRREG